MARGDFDVHVLQDEREAMKLKLQTQEQINNLISGKISIDNLFSSDGLSSVYEWTSFADEWASYLNPALLRGFSLEQITDTLVEILQVPDNQFVTKQRLVSYLIKDLKDKKRLGYEAVALAASGYLGNHLPISFSRDAVKTSLKYCIEEGTLNSDITRLLEKRSGINSMALIATEFIKDKEVQPYCVDILKKVPLEYSTNIGTKLRGLLRNMETRETILDICESRGYLQRENARELLSKPNLKHLGQELIKRYLKD
ncbi:hypothetical protein HN789_07415 [archaeon]|jgi:hypothetical protein|nr:hypothetical protein [archaeon]MBT4273147.1 hypothetical protein [archaeon]MBT4461374.1 hypothetical protein [archaeon]MBT4858880.1 hypothetical protein [archaeon]MBT5423450.1 hypothetical protein [archaeon]